MAHFSGEQFVTLLGLLAASHVKEYPEHEALVQPGVIAKSTGGNPPDDVAQHHAKVDFVRSDNRACCRKSGAHPVPIGGMNMCRKVFEGDSVGLRKTPMREALLIHRELVRIDIPRPERDPGGLQSAPKVFRLPQGVGILDRRHRSSKPNGTGR